MQSNLWNNWHITAEEALRSTTVWFQIKLPMNWLDNMQCYNCFVVTGNQMYGLNWHLLIYARSLVTTFFSFRQVIYLFFSFSYVIHIKHFSFRVSIHTCSAIVIVRQDCNSRKLCTTIVNSCFFLTKFLVNQDSNKLLWHHNQVLHCQVIIRNRFGYNW